MLNDPSAIESVNILQNISETEEVVNNIEAEAQSYFGTPVPISCYYASRLINIVEYAWI